MSSPIQALRGYLARPAQGRIVAVCCAALLVALALYIHRRATAVDPRTIVTLPTRFHFSCTACAHGWEVETSGEPIQGQMPSRHMTLPCPQCGKQTGQLLDACPWCRRGLPREAATRICPHCHKDPDKWTAGH